MGIGQACDRSHLGVAEERAIEASSIPLGGVQVEPDLLDLFAGVNEAVEFRKILGDRDESFVGVANPMFAENSRNRIGFLNDESQCGVFFLGVFSPGKDRAELVLGLVPLVELGFLSANELAKRLDAGSFVDERLKPLVGELACLARGEEGGNDIGDAPLAHIAGGLVALPEGVDGSKEAAL